MKRESLRKYLELRRYLYFFMGKSLYSVASIRLLEEARENGVFRELKKIEFPGCNLISDFLDGEIDLKKLEDEYIRLFASPKGVLVPAWESVYRSRESIIFDEHTLDVREFYAKFNIANSDKSLPDDHLGYELEFISYLIGKTIEELDRGDYKFYLKAQEEFLNKHILSYIEEFTYRLIVETELDFYKGIGLFLSEYLRLDNQILSELIS